jgi:hypothetical protein
MRAFARPRNDARAPGVHLIVSDFTSEKWPENSEKNLKNPRVFPADSF